MTATRIEPVLRGLTALFVVIALGALFWRPSAPRTEIAPAGLTATPTSRSAAAADPAMSQAIIAANIFSPSRTTPRSRYNPFEPDPVTVEPAFGNNIIDSAAIPDEEVIPRLFGIVVGPAGGSALMRLDPAQPEAQLYREGDRGGVYRVVKVNQQSVILSGPRGQTVLQLKRPEGP
ncbi:MAG: hypothetical protein WEE89_08260 [Gemmatimonadota bacterium]